MVSLPPPRTTELFFDGTWNDITPDMRDSSAITIRRGRSAEGARVDPGAASAVIDNRSSDYSPRNPNSRLYGKIGRNTPIRISVDVGGPWLETFAGTASRATTPDTAALDIVGDIDVRMDVAVANWAPGQVTELVGKASTAGNQRSWMLLLLADGRLELSWSVGGADPREVRSSTVVVPAHAGQRLALRVTLDVDNGSGGNTTTFYTARTLDDDWRQLGAPITAAGTTSIYAGTAPLDIGNIAGMAFFRQDLKTYGLQVRDGIDGTLVADVDVSKHGIGATSFTDDSGLVWSVESGAILTNRHVRMVGEVPAWPPGRDLSGNDRHSAIAPAGITRRLGAGNKPLRSVLSRALTADDHVPPVIAYWPAEDESEAMQITSAVPGGASMSISGTPTLSSFTGFVASAALPVMKDAAFAGLVPTYTVTGETQVRFLMAIPSDGITDLAVICRLSTTGTARTWDLIYGTGGGLRLLAYDADGVLIDASSTGVFGADGKLFMIALELTQNGGNVDAVIASLEPGAPAGNALPHTFPGTTVGAITSISIGPGGGLGDTAVGHVSLQDDISSLFDLGSQLAGYAGERAGTRIVRVAAEQSVTAITSGDTDAQARLGPQRQQKFLEILNEAAKADLGFLIEQRDALALTYRGRSTLYSQSPTITLDFSAGLISAPFRPLDDDKLTQNEVTVTREGASTSPPAVLGTGRMSVQDPPDGVGRYDVNHTLSLQDDALALQTAEWLLHLGTFDGLRYTKLALDLANPRVYTMIDDILRADVGDLIRITNLPAEYGPDDVDLIIQGYSEEMGPEVWKITFNCTPGEPWSVAVADDPVLGRADTDGSVLGVAATSTATTLVVHTTQSDVGTMPLWTQDPAEYPFDLRVGGEVVTASDATSLAEDTFTRTVAAGSWGTSSDGHTYTLTNGSASDRSVAGTYGVVTLSSAPTTIRHQTVAETCADTEIRAAVAVSATATGASLVPAITARWVSTSAYYRVRVEHTTAGGITLTLTRAGTVVGSSVSTGVTYTPGSITEVRVRIIGDRVLARVWAAGSDEPGTWHLDRTVTSSPIAEGVVGLAASGLTGNSNVSPEIRFHNWMVLSPQRVTVTRSTNGIVKAHLAGTDVRLAQPATAAL